jgi:hypothetical protein
MHSIPLSSWITFVISQRLLGRGHTILTSRELMRYYACSWDVIGDLTLNSMTRIHSSVTLLTSRGGRLTRQHASHISVVAHISWGVTNVRVQTVQPVPNRYTDCAIPVPNTAIYNGGFPPCLFCAYTAVLISLRSSETQRRDAEERVDPGTALAWQWAQHWLELLYQRYRVVSQTTNLQVHRYSLNKQWNWYFQRNTRIVWGIPGIYRCIVNTV